MAKVRKVVECNNGQSAGKFRTGKTSTTNNYTKYNRSENSHMEIKNLSKKEITFSLYGLLLGDGSYRNGKIQCRHTNKQKFYVEWLEKICKDNNILFKTTYDFTLNTTFGEREYSSIDIKVPNRYYFENEYDFYKNRKKIVLEYVLKNITKLGLLFWFLDDGQWHVSKKGTKTKRFGYLNTQSFTYEENKNIVTMFKERFDIDLKIHTDNSGFEKQKDKVYYRIYFNATAFRKFYDIVRPYLNEIPKEFYYKFDMKYEPNRMKNSLEFSKKYNLV